MIIKNSLSAEKENTKLLHKKCRLGGVVVSVLATGPKGYGFELAKAMDF
jgi:hypothetical protein